MDIRTTSLLVPNATTGGAHGAAAVDAFIDRIPQGLDRSAFKLPYRVKITPHEGKLQHAIIKNVNHNVDLFRNAIVELTNINCIELKYK